MYQFLSDGAGAASAVVMVMIAASAVIPVSVAAPGISSAASAVIIIRVVIITSAIGFCVRSSDAVGKHGREAAADGVVLRRYIGHHGPCE